MDKEKQAIANERRDMWQRRWALSDDIEEQLVLALAFSLESGLTRAEVVSVIYDRDNFGTSQMPIERSRGIEMATILVEYDARRCVECGKEFPVTRADRQHCSRACTRRQQVRRWEAVNRDKHRVQHRARQERYRERQRALGRHV